VQQLLLLLDTKQTCCYLLVLAFAAPAWIGAEADGIMLQNARQKPKQIGTTLWCSLLLQPLGAEADSIRLQMLGESLSNFWVTLDLAEVPRWRPGRTVLDVEG